MRMEAFFQGIWIGRHRKSTAHKDSNSQVDI